MSREFETKIRVRRADYGYSPFMHMLLFKRERGKLFTGKIEWEHMEQEGMDCGSCLSMDNTMGQELMDSLWECGVRPTEGTGSAGSLKATERHLADMQKLVFKGK